MQDNMHSIYNKKHHTQKIDILTILNINMLKYNTFQKCI